MKHDSQRALHSGAFGSALGAFLVAALAAKLAWWLLVPVVAAGAVEQGAISASLPLGSAALFGGIVGAVVFFVRHPRRHAHRSLQGASNA